VTIQELLDEIDQNPDVEYEIDRWVVPLFDKMLNEHGYKFQNVRVIGDFIRCKIQRILSET
jgi:hypothetical protein